MMFNNDGLLSTLLSAYRLRTRVTDRAQYCGRWRDSDAQAPAGTAWFHLIDQGSCTVHCQAFDEPVHLGAGDLMVLPHGDPHELIGDTESQTGHICTIPYGFTTMLCGEFIFDAAAARPMLDALPPVMVIRTGNGHETFRRLADLLLMEARSGGFGSRAVLDKLGDALFVMTLRHHLSVAETRKGLFAALTDPNLHRALDAIHRDPGRHWSVAALADLACLSRTAFSVRFTQALGEAPFQYLTHWRMTQGLQLLLDPRMSVGRVSEHLGYQNEASFRRTFKRIHGYGPGALRRRHTGAIDNELESEPL